MTSTNQLDQLTTAFAGRYRLERELGAGGMATVYLAADLKHDRKVAIKVLKPELAAVLGADRFVVEIKTTASLQHPHILPLFDSGTVDGLPFYVMPYIEGETIRDKLNRESQFGVDESVRITRQVADALDYAHRHGVIHRDIKPENILLHDGSPMVMDFGIALAVSAAAGGRMTETGLSLGTPHYMSPEQATADKDISGRSDIYSLASVLYEMLAGQPPHVGGSAQQIIMKIIAEPVAPVTRVRKSVPPYVAAALEKALEKLPADRFENAKAFSEALGNPGFTTANVASGVTGRSPLRGGVYQMLFAATAIVALLAIASLVWSLRRTPATTETPVVRVSVALQPGERFYPAAGGSSIAISPQGDRLVYVAQSGTGAHLMMRRTDEVAARELTPNVVTGPVFSPDGRWIAYADGPDVKKVPVDGGASLLVTSALACRGLAWLGPDSLVVGTDLGMFVVASKGGTPRRIVEVDSTDLAMNPVVLPDGKTIVYATGGGVAIRRLGVVSLASHRSTRLETAATAAIGLREGHLLYVTATGALEAVPFDVKAQRVTGDPVQLEADVRISGGGAPLASLSENGSLWFLSGQTLSHLVRAVDGKPETPLFDQTRAFRTPRFSPDGRNIAVELNEVKGTSVWVYDLASGTFSLLANDASYPEWSGDGKRIVFRSTDSRKPGIWWQFADGSAKAELLYKPDDPINEALLSGDGKWLLYRTSPGLHNRDIYGVPLDGDRKPVLLVGGPAQESHMRLSPDGKWLAYESNESGPFEVYVRPFPNDGSRVQISNDGGAEPLWSKSGNAIFYRTPLGGVESVSVKSEGTALTVGERRLVLQPTEYLTDVTHASYDVWPDGSGFLMVKPVGSDARPMLVVNWGRVLRETLGLRQ